MICSNCCITSKRFGKDRKGHQRFRCPKRGRTVTESHNGSVRGTYAPTEKAESVIRLLVEGNSIRSIEIITGMHRDTIMHLLFLMSERCKRWLDDRIRFCRVHMTLKVTPAMEQGITDHVYSIQELLKNV